MPELKRGNSSPENIPTSKVRVFLVEVVGILPNANPIPNQKKKKSDRSSCYGSVVNESKNHEVEGLIPDLTQWVKDPVLP